MTERVDLILADDDARKALKERCLAELALRRRGRWHAGNFLTVWTILAATALVLAWSIAMTSADTHVVNRGMFDGPGVVPAQPSPAAPFVRTQPAPPEALVTTRTLADDRRVSTQRGTTLVVRTSPRALPLGDAQLLASFPGRPVGIVTEPDGTRELVFLDRQGGE